MSDLHRAEMAESKLRAIREIARHTVDVDAGREIRTIVDAEVWDGYQVVDVTFTGSTQIHFDHKEP